MKNLDLALFVGLLIGFGIMVFFAPDISDKEFFMSGIIGNEIWQYIIFGTALFVLGVRLVDGEEKVER